MQAPLPGVEDLALRTIARRMCAAPSCSASSARDKPLSGLGAGDVLIVADEELRGRRCGRCCQGGRIIVIGTTLPAWARHAAAVVLPIANFVEEEGTFTNLRGRVQRFMQAKAAPGFARPSWYVAVGDLLAAMGGRPSYSLASDVFAALAAAHAGVRRTVATTRSALKGAMHRPARWREAATCMIASAALLQTAAAATTDTACSISPRRQRLGVWFIADGGEDAPHLHDLHGRRR